MYILVHGISAVVQFGLYSFSQSYSLAQRVYCWAYEKNRGIITQER